MTANQDMAAFAAAVYGPDTADRAALSRFVEKLKASGARVGGILQEELAGPGGEGKGIDAIDISTGRRIAIKRPPKHAAKDDDACGLDVFALTETTGIIRDAIKDRPDLVVVEKFGAQEEKGEGLSDEILQTIAEGIPLLIAVPEKALPTWRLRSGDLGRVLPFNEDAFHEWWRGVKAASRR